MGTWQIASKGVHSDAVRSTNAQTAYCFYKLAVLGVSVL